MKRLCRILDRVSGWYVGSDRSRADRAPALPSVADPQSAPKTVWLGGLIAGITAIRVA